MGKLEKSIVDFLDSTIINLMQLKTDIKEYEKRLEEKQNVENINAFLKEQREGNFKGILANQNQQNKKNSSNNTNRIIDTNNTITAIHEIKKYNNDDGGNAKMTKRKDGRLMARFRMGNGNYKYVYGKTRQEVNEKLELAKKEYEEEKGKTTLSSKMKLKDYIDYYYSKISNVKETSMSVYESAIQTIKKSRIGEKRVNAITLDDLFEFVETQKNVKTVQRNAIIVLKTAFAKLLEIGLIKYNYATLLKVDNTPTEKNEHKYICINTIYKMLNDCKKDKSLYKVCSILAYTGCRIGEVLALESNDIDLQNRTINISKQKTPNGEIQTTKSKSSIRKIPMMDELYAILNELSPDIPMPSQATVRKHLSYYGILPHDLRHTFATNCFVLEKNAKQVQLWLGHANYSMTIDTYTHCPKISNEEKQLISKFFEISE